MAESVQLHLLRRAVQLSGGMADLSRDLGMGASEISRMLASAEVPQWMFLRLADYMNEREFAGGTRLAPPGAWTDKPKSDASS